MLFYSLSFIALFAEIQALDPSVLAKFQIECANANSVKWTDVEKIDVNKLSEVPPSYLCALQCFYERTKIIKDDRTVDIDRYFRIKGDDRPNSSESTNGTPSQQFIECLEKTGKIKKCCCVAKILRCKAKFG